MPRYISSDYYYQFLEEIDEGDYRITDWESDFLENLLKHRPQHRCPERDREATHA